MTSGGHDIFLTTALSVQSGIHRYDHHSLADLDTEPAELKVLELAKFGRNLVNLCMSNQLLSETLKLLLSNCLVVHNCWSNAYWEFCCVNMPLREVPSLCMEKRQHHLL